MVGTTCPVRNTILKLEETIDSGQLNIPRSRRIAEEIQGFLKDISLGRADEEHIPAITSLAQELVQEGPDESSVSTGKLVTALLVDHPECLNSHVETHNCPTGDCVRLAPAPCQMACPAGIDVPTYVSLIAEGRDAEAIDVIRKDNPFPWVCGLVCTHPCEFMCVRGRIDKAVAIKDLKAFAAEKAMSEGRYPKPERAVENGHKVCIIGAGPAGLTAAYYLALRGYQVTVIEALAVAGGMLMVGIPRYRLPREVIDREVALIEDLGVEFRYKTRLGIDTSIDSLREEGFKAFYVAVGAHECYKMHIKGEDDFLQVIGAVPFLRRVALGDRHAPGYRVAVIGGGNVAIDAARTCIRLGCEDVIILYRRTRAEMPADVAEVEQAEEEGVRFSFLTIPVELLGSDYELTGVRCLRAELSDEDKSGRRRPIPVEGSEHVYKIDALVTAIGQATSSKGLDSLQELKWSKRNSIMADTITGLTGEEGVFAGGDAVLGPATVVEAIGAGKRTAEAIDRYLQGIPQPKLPPVPKRRQRVECYEMPATTKMALHRSEMPILGTERRRITFQQVELGYTENMAREEAQRCLRCDICIRCNRCVEVCRDDMQIDALQLGYFDFDHPEPTDYRVTAERCILCGACAANCPTDAMVMEDIGKERVLKLCGTLLNRLELEYCGRCGEVLGPTRYHDYITKRIEGISQYIGDEILCMGCARKVLAQQHVDIVPPKLKN